VLKCSKIILKEQHAGVKNFFKKIAELFGYCYIAIIVILVSLIFLLLYFSVGGQYSSNLQHYLRYRAILVVSFAAFVSGGGVLSAAMRIRRLERERKFKEETFIENMLIKIASEETLQAKVKVMMDSLLNILKISKAVILMGKKKNNLSILYNFNFDKDEISYLENSFSSSVDTLETLRKKYTVALDLQIYGSVVYIFIDRKNPLTTRELEFLRKYGRAARPLFANALLFDLILEFMIELQKVGTVYNAYWKMLDMAVRVFNADSGTVVDVRDEPENWSFIAVKNVASQHVEAIEKVMNSGHYNGPIMEIIRNKKVLYIKDTREYSTWVITGEMPLSYIGIPFIIDGRVVAVMNLYGKTPNKFSVYEVNLAKAIMEMGSAIVERTLYLEQLGVYSSVDEMTALFNKREFMQRLGEEIRRANRYGRNLSMLIFDLDNFKEWNDTYGHLAGDRLLRELGSIIKNTVRSTDLPFRFGGDEFVVLFPETSIDGASLIARKILENIAERFGHYEVKLSASAGIAEYKPGESIESFISRADRALYTAKNGGKNRIEIAS
jgi:diguanylate cyclase (GGDEF)-like protein